MKNKRGFTLIELLAVIVILAIIALVTVPIIMNMIKTAKKKAAVSAAYGYIDAINYNNNLASMNNDYGINYEKIDDDTDIAVATINAKVKMKGKKPTGGTVTISGGKVTEAQDLEFEGYKVDYDGKTATIDGESSGSSSSSSNTQNENYTYYGLVDISEDPILDSDDPYCDQGEYNEETEKCEYKVAEEISNINDVNVYIKSNGNSKELCKVFSGGTVCMTSPYYNSDYSTEGKYESDFSNCGKVNKNIDYSCLTGYTKEKADDMLSKGSAACKVHSGTQNSYSYLFCKYSSATYAKKCYIFESGDISCEDGDYSLGIGRLGEIQ